MEKVILKIVLQRTDLEKYISIYLSIYMFIFQQTDGQL